MSGLLLLAGQAPVGAQATRTWVSGVGDDANPCSRTAPCKTFAGAISKTAATGEINVLDPGGYGAVTITKSISIIGEGFTAGVLVSGTNGIVVSAGANDIVVLRGLDFQGLGTGLRGVSFVAGGALYVEDTTIHGFGGSPGHGISVETASPAEVYLQNVEIRNNDGSALYLKSTSGGSQVKATINNSRLDNNNVGLDARDHSRVTIRDSVVSGNTNAGIQGVLDSGGATTEINVESTISTANATGIQSGNGTGTSTIRLANATIYGNVNGLSSAGGSSILSFGNNMIAGNSTDGSTTGNIPLR